MALNLMDEVAVARAVERMREAVKKAKPEAMSDRFLVEAIAPAPLAELIVGIRQDPQYGLAMTLGSGRHSGRTGGRCAHAAPARLGGRYRRGAALAQGIRIAVAAFAGVPRRTSMRSYVH